MTSSNPTRANYFAQLTSIADNHAVVEGAAATITINQPPPQNSGPPTNNPISRDQIQWSINWLTGAPPSLPAQSIVNGNLQLSWSSFPAQSAGDYSFIARIQFRENNATYFYDLRQVFLRVNSAALLWDAPSGGAAHWFDYQTGRPRTYGFRLFGSERTTAKLSVHLDTTQFAVTSNRHRWTESPEVLRLDHVPNSAGLVELTIGWRHNAYYGLAGNLIGQARVVLSATNAAETSTVSLTVNLVILPSAFEWANDTPLIVVSRTCLLYTSPSPRD